MIGGLLLFTTSALHDTILAFIQFMPLQTQPPYLPTARVQPRQLNRWLDINAQNGALKRTQTFISLPTFTQAASSWNGYSDIVVAFNFEGDNNFALKVLGEVSNSALTATQTTGISPKAIIGVGGDALIDVGNDVILGV